MHTLGSSTNTFSCKAKEDRESLPAARKSHQPGPRFSFSLLRGIRSPNCRLFQKSENCFLSAEIQRIHTFCPSFPT